MERLTKMIDGHAHGAEGVSVDKLTGKYCRGEFEATALVEKLAYYENLEESGKLFILPCKINQRVYEIFPEVSEIDVHRICLEDVCKVGITVFCTWDEAWEALKRMEDEEG